jgi:alkylation response protein AidB-like acyl-CoA dehydrogenase
MSAPPSAAALGSPAVTALLAEIGAGAAERERLDESPFEQVAAVARAGLGTLSLPVSEGGHGASIPELFAFVVDLAEADPVVAHVLRTHYSQVLGFLRLTDPDVRRRWLDEVRAGKVFGNAISETGAVSAGSHEFATRLDEVDARLVLNGTKYYSTGTMFSDWIAVAARVEGDRLATVLVPADREGVTIVDDWDGMGQSRTGTGTTSFSDVAIGPDDVLVVRDRLTPRPAADVPFLQLYLHAVIAGILRSVVTDAAELVRSRSRTFDHAPSPRPVDDPILQETVGRLAATSWIAESAVSTAAGAVEAAEAAVRAGEPTEEVGRAASIAISAVKVHLDRVATDAATALFDVGGASASGRARNLDRHWRNIRTITLHNPASYKAAALGRLAISDEPLPVNGYF